MDRTYALIHKLSRVVEVLRVLCARKTSKCVIPDGLLKIFDYVIILYYANLFVLGRG